MTAGTSAIKLFYGRNKFRTVLNWSAGHSLGPQERIGAYRYSVVQKGKAPNLAYWTTVED
jgi:hypothetical protein